MPEVPVMTRLKPINAKCTQRYVKLCNPARQQRYLFTNIFKQSELCPCFPGREKLNFSTVYIYLEQGILNIFLNQIFFLNTVKLYQGAKYLGIENEPVRKENNNVKDYNEFSMFHRLTGKNRKNKLSIS